MATFAGAAQPQEHGLAPLDVFLKGLPWVPLDDDVVGGIVEGINQWDQKHSLGAGVAPSAVNSSNVQ